MKKICILALILPLILLLIPLPAAKKFEEAVIKTNAIIPEDEPQNTLPQAEKSISFRLLDSQSGEIHEISAEDYICGVVAAEMPALYEIEALKAQAVAAYTFACRRKAVFKDREYDISTDPAKDQSYITEAAAREKWGEKADEYLTKIRNAVEDVSGYAVTYDDKAALTVYHAISSGRTEDAENVWGTKVDYLVPVDSSGDATANGYTSTATFSSEELKNRISSLCGVSGEEKEWFGSIKTTDSGTVKSIDICGKSVSGNELRETLELRSSCFEVSFSDGVFTFTVRGYGHGVGMSQYGANEMAKQGSDFKEILCHYYKGCKVEIITEG